VIDTKLIGKGVERHGLSNRQDGNGMYLHEEERLFL
jgi:hypothetical protein